MNVSEDVIRDLLPVYAAGEASAGTRALVEQSLSELPELRAAAASLRAIPIADASPPDEIALSSLRRTQLLLRRRCFLVGSGYLLTTLPLALAGRAWGPVWFGVPALRLLATGLSIASAALWLAFLRNARDLHGTGFGPLRTRGPVWAWGFGCWWFATSAAVVANEWFPGRSGIFECALLVLAIWVVGLKLGQFRTLFDIDTPLSLFGDGDDHQNL